MWFAVLALNVLLLIGLWITVKYRLGTDVTRPRCLAVAVAFVAGSLLVGSAGLLYVDLTVLLSRRRSAFSHLSTYVLLALPGLQGSRLLCASASAAGSSMAVELEKCRRSLPWGTSTVLNVLLFFYVCTAFAGVVGAVILSG